MIVLLGLSDGKDVKDDIDEQTFQTYLEWSTSGQTGGPTVVATNLLQELRLHKEVLWTLVTPVARLDSRYTVMWVVNGLEDLYWAIQYKTELGVQELWAGPNLIVIPQEGQGIIGHPLIDKIIVPCRWPGEVYAQLMPSICYKIVIWAVGIDADYWSPMQATERNRIIIYDKGNTALADELSAGLASAGETVSRITYGKYDRDEYKTLLQQAKAIVWLSPTESQGIALLEALSMDVPALCWRNVLWKYYSSELQGMVEYDGATSAPYFNNQCGLFFENVTDFFACRYPEFNKNRNSFSPRRYLFENNLVIGKSLAGVIGELKRLSI